MMKLPTRLEYIFSMTQASRCTIDVGTDHGKLAAALALSGRAERVIASDVNAGPLEKANELVDRLGLSGRVDTRLTDGLNGLKNSGADQIIIAGMGGELIASIIDSAPWAKNAAVHFVLQPMTTSPELRMYLHAAGFQIEREGAVTEDGRPYEVLAARFYGESRSCTPEEVEIGGAFEGKKEDVRALLIKKRNALEKRLIGAEKKSVREAKIIKHLITEINKRLEEE